VYTLDTNAIIYYLNGDRAVMQSLEDIIDQGAPRYVSTITVLELFSRRGLSDRLSAPPPINLRNFCAKPSTL
jgi:predicted nucleic acid-binding protein